MRNELEACKEVFHNPESKTGLSWRNKNAYDCPDVRKCDIFNKNYGGKDAGGIKTNRHGYSIYRVVINGIHYVNSRLIYIIHNGEIPEGMEVDHIDNDSLNNKIENFRLATSSQNRANSKSKSNNKLGIKGVSQKGSRFRANIETSNGIKYIGTFNTSEEANDAYMSEAIKIHGEFARSK